MQNNLNPPTGGSVGASIFSGTMLRNHFLAAKNDISRHESGVERLPATGPRTECVTSEQVLRVVGYEEMTATNCNQFRKAACAAWNGHRDVEIDLSETTLIDCAGVGALIAVRNLTQKRKGMTRLMNPTSSVQQMLDLTRTGQLFDIVNTAEASIVFGPAHN